MASATGDNNEGTEEVEEEEEEEEEGKEEGEEEQTADAEAAMDPGTAAEVAPDDEDVD